jgi:copper resistance protein C
MKYAVMMVSLLICTAFAHAYLMGSSPSAGQTVRVIPKTIMLEFGEPLEIGFSTFKVYALPASSDLKKTAEDLSAKMLLVKEDGAARADLGLVSSISPAARLELKLRTDLKPGWYVVMWRALSTDGHSTTDHFIFRYSSQ